MGALLVLLPFLLVTLLPTYLWLRERRKRLTAEAAAGIISGPDPAPFVPWALQDLASVPGCGASLPPPLSVASVASGPASSPAVPAPGWTVDPNPPRGMAPIVAALNQVAPHDPFGFGVMWVVPRDSGPRQLVHASLLDPAVKVNFLLGTGEPEHGKNVLIDHMLLPMLSRTTPSQLRICIFDGTRADGALARGCVHNWVEPLLEEADVALGMRAWNQERRRRERLLDQYSVTKWENLPDDVRPPLLLFIVNELTVLAKGMAKGAKFEDWLDVELKAMRKCGMRAWLFTQNANRMETPWRDTCSMKIAGYQPPAERLVIANTGLATSDIKRAGALPPSELLEKGMFTVIEKGLVVTGRTSLISDDERSAAYRLGSHGPARQVAEVVRQLARLLNEPDDDERAPERPPSPVSPTLSTEVPDGMEFRFLPMNEQYRLIRVWEAQGLTGNEIIAKMRPLQRQRAQQIIRSALDSARATVMLADGPEDVDQ